MSAFDWDACFDTELALVDEQHHRLVDLINRFGDLLMQAQGASVEEIEALFGELARYAETHFRDEESLMGREGLALQYIADHHREHKRFIHELTRLHANPIAGKPEEAASKLLGFLTNWLAYHILGTDQVMARQVSAIRAGATAEQAYETRRATQDPATVMLLHSLDALFEQVTERNHDLIELNQTLEQRVAERTQELTEANQRMADMALTDALTGLPNRRQALMRMQQDWPDTPRDDAPLSCIMIDADGFKGINDTHGHDAGDEVLRRLGRQLRDFARNDDCVCRLGGDEFLVICPHTPLTGALLLAEKLRAAVATLRVPAGDGEWRGSISAGAATRQPGMQGTDELLKAADEGLYLAKRNGRNAVATVQTR